MTTPTDPTGGNWIVSLIGTLAAAGVLSGIGTAIRGVVRWATGREARDRATVRGARREAELEYDRRRETQEVAARIRLIAIERGIPEDALPEVPRWTADDAHKRAKEGR